MDSQPERQNDAAADAAARSDPLRSLALGVFVTFGIRIYGAVLQYLTQLYLARTIFAEQVGIYAFAWTVVTLLAFLTPLGFDTSIVRFLPEDLARQSWGRVHGLLRLSQRTTIGYSVVAALFTAAFVLGVDRALDSHYSIALLLGVAMIPVLGLLNLYQGIARGFHWVLSVAGPSYFLRPTIFFVGAWVAIEVFQQRTGEAMVVAALAACVLTLIPLVIGMRRHVPARVRAAAPIEDAKLWRRTSLPMMLVASFELLVANTDILMMGLIRGPGETGVYNIAVRTSSSLLFMFFAMTSFAAPRIAEHYGRGERDALLRFAAKMRLLAALPTCAGALVLVLVGRMLFELFGEEFSGAYLPCLVLTAGVVCRTLAGPSDSLLTMTGRERQLALVLAIACFVNIALNALLIPFFGGNGAAFATLTSVVVEVLMIATLAGKHIGFRPFLFTPTRGGHEQRGKS